MNRWKIAVAVVPFALAVACTDANKAPAEAAMAAAGAAVESLKGEAAKFAPEAVKGVEGAYAAAKGAIAKEDYKGALAAAQEIPAKAKEALAKAASAKQELVKAWTDASGQVSGLIDAGNAKLAELAKAKKLPAGVEKAAVAKAKEGLDALQGEWAKVSEQYKAGDWSGATAKAKELGAKAQEILKSIGIGS